MTLPTADELKAIEDADKALLESDDGADMLASYPSMQHRHVLLLLVRHLQEREREARKLLEDGFGYDDIPRDLYKRCDAWLAAPPVES